MPEQLEARLRDLARRAGLSGVPPAAVAAALVLCAAIVVLAAWRWWPRSGESSAAREPVGASVASAPERAGKSDGLGGADATAAGSTPASSSVFVHVVGAVRHPGLFELPGGARVAEAIRAAGGLAGNAAQAGINLARPVTDGEQVVVPTLDEFASGGPPAAAGAGAAGGTGAAGATGGALVNINTADAAALDALPGVGPSTAAKIIAEREANGPFKSAEDLGRVAGIGPKKLEELAPRVSVN